jgi:hypothetical protein
VDAVCAGALLVRREAFQVIEPPWFSYEGGGDFPEFYFGDRAMRAGVQPLVDLSVVCESGGVNAEQFLLRYGGKKMEEDANGKN